METLADPYAYANLSLDIQDPTAQENDVPKALFFLLCLTLLLWSSLPPALSFAAIRHIKTPHGGCLNVRTGPGMEFKSVTCLPNGQQINPVSAQDTWLKLANGNWVFGPYTLGQEVAISTEKPTIPTPDQGLGPQGFLTLGSRGPLVQEVQRRLITLGYNVGPTGADGVFGTQTQQAVIRFQKDRGLEYADGKVGQETLTALGVSIGGPITTNPKPNPPQPPKPDNTTDTVYRDCENANAEIIAPGEGVIVRAGPNIASEPVGSPLLDGTKVRVEERLNQWYRLDGTILNLWVPASQVRITGQSVAANRAL